MDPYRELEARYRQIGALREAAGMLHWDMAVMMPPGGADGRAEQLAALKQVTHRMESDPALGELLDRADGTGGADPWQRANLGEMRRRWIHAVAVDSDLVEAATRARLACEMAWRHARPASDFAAVRPRLEEVLDLTRKQAEARALALGCSPYEALLDAYEPGARTDMIDRLFADLAAFLPGFLDRALSVQEDRRPLPLPCAAFAVERQQVLARRLMEALGFDFDRGRLDVSLHPFCGGASGDVRVTTRYADDDFSQSIMGVVHETGHALYEMGLPRDWRYQPVGEARGMTLHESQSLLVEMQVGRSREFFEFAAPLIAAAFDGDGPAWEAGNLHLLHTRVAPGLIRVDADEVTYPAHVILRYRIERALIEGGMSVADIPGAWSDGLFELLGVRPPDDRLGCLQDIHWYDGAWGYFPTYTLGALAAAQLFAAAKAQVPDLMAAISKGEFAGLLAWLREHVHGRASSATTDELVAAATGAPLGTAAFKAHLEARYG